MGNEAFMQLGLKLNGGQWGQWSPLYFHVRGWFVCPVLVYCWLDRLLTANLCLWFAQLSLNKDIFPANVEWQWLTTYDELCLQPPATVFRLQKRNQNKETSFIITSNGPCYSLKSFHFVSFLPQTSICLRNAINLATPHKEKKKHNPQTYVCMLLHFTYIFTLIFSSVQFSHSVLYDSLRPHEPQHGRPHWF